MLCIYRIDKKNLQISTVYMSIPVSLVARSNASHVLFECPCEMHVCKHIYGCSRVCWLVGGCSQRPPHQKPAMISRRKNLLSPLARTITTKVLKLSTFIKLRVCAQVLLYSRILGRGGMARALGCNVQQQCLPTVVYFISQVLKQT